MALDTFNPYLFVSAGEQSNKFLTPAYADGIARFQAQRAQELTGLTVQFGPIQEGTGDPSPSNIRPISGRNGLSVAVAGKNLMPRSTIDRTVQGITVKANADGTIHITGTATGETSVQVYTNFILPAGKYVWSSGLNETFQTYDTYLSSSGTIARGNSNAPGPVFTLTETRNVSANVRVRGGQTVDITVKPMVRLYGESDEYVPYIGSAVYPVTWETEAGTVYGGTLDVVNGVLTVEWDYIASYNGETLPGEWISDRDVYAEGTTPTTGAEVAYKLAEPVTYQLDPEQVMTVPGFNQVYSDAGPVIDIKF